METAKNTIQKAKIKDSKLEVIYEEHFSEENYSNTIEKRCAQIVHNDLRTVFDKLKVHLINVCEMPEATMIHAGNIYDSNFEDINNYIITGYSHGGSDESAGVTITGQKLLKSGQVLNINTPFIKFMDEEAYQFAGVLFTDIQACDYEVEQYLFNSKFGIKQLDFDFDAPEESFMADGVTLEVKPKKSRNRKKKEIAEELVDTAFDEYFKK